MSTSRRRLSRRHYQIAWIAPTSNDFLAASAVLDEHFEIPLDLPEDDENDYIFGRIGSHNVVIGTFPEGQAGLEHSNKLGRDMMSSFRSLRFGLVVGTAGGAPSKSNDIRLGDIVVSTPNSSKRLGGVVDYFYGASIQGKGMELRGHLNAPPTVLLNAVRVLGTKHHGDRKDINQHVCQLLAATAPLLDDYLRPDQTSDILFKPNFLHKQTTNECTESCLNTPEEIIQRVERPPHALVQVHYGVVGSTSNLMRDAILRDKLAKEEGVLCFEMESASLMNSTPGWLAIRGISNYSDTHKNDIWQNYAAAVAAVYAKDLLGETRPKRIPEVAVDATSASDRQDHLYMINYESVGRNGAIQQLEPSPSTIDLGHRHSIVRLLSPTTITNHLRRQAWKKQYPSPSSSSTRI